MMYLTQSKISIFYYRGEPYGEGVLYVCILSTNEVKYKHLRLDYVVTSLFMLYVIKRVPIQYSLMFVLSWL